MSCFQSRGSLVDLIDPVSCRHHGIQIQLPVLLPFKKHRKVTVRRTGPANAADEVFFVDQNVNGVQFRVPGAERVPVMVAALGPVMLKLAGELADGTITWMVGPKTMGEHIVPRIRKAAENGGRPEPTIVGSFPIVLTNKPDEARESIGKSLAMYGTLPSYRAMLDREGVAGPGDIAIAGDENALRGEIKRLEDMGVTDFNASIMPVEEGAFERTLEFLASLKG